MISLVDAPISYIEASHNLNAEDSFRNQRLPIVAPILIIPYAMPCQVGAAGELVGGRGPPFGPSTERRCRSCPAPTLPYRDATLARIRPMNWRFLVLWR